MKKQALITVSATEFIAMAFVISMIFLFVGIAVLVLIHVCIVGRAFRRELRTSNAADRSSFGSASMSRDDVEKLPCFDFKVKDKGSSPADCAVCLEDFKAGDKCRLLPQCKHSFHAECVDLWLLKTPLCPICRASADLSKAGAIFEEESSRHTQNGAGFTDSATTEGGNLGEAAAAIELRELRAAESYHWTAAGNDPVERQTTRESTQSSASVYRHLGEGGSEQRERQAIECGYFSRSSVEAGGTQTLESNVARCREGGGMSQP